MDTLQIDTRENAPSRGIEYPLNGTHPGDGFFNEFTMEGPYMGLEHVDSKGCLGTLKGPLYPWVHLYNVEFTIPQDEVHAI